MFSILNEISNNSHFTTTSAVVTSAGVAYTIYVLVGVTGYLSFGNNISGNIIAMCKSIDGTGSNPVIYSYGVNRPPLPKLDHRKGRYCYSCHVLLSSPSPSL
jgi:hypothetical protein